MMANIPKVTVYIPTHNYARYLDQAVQSVLRQTMPDWELIIIDDGSTDNTRAILDKYRDTSKIRIIEQENQGLNVSNNIALRLAQGRYIMRLDADDYLDENILLILSNILDFKPEIGLVYPDYYHVDEQGEVIEIVRRKKVGEEVEILDLPAHGACTMIRRELLLEVGGYHEGFSCQDGYDLWLKMIARYQTYNVNIPLFYYRQHPGSLTRKQAKILETRRSIKRHFVMENLNGERPKVLGIVPVVGRSIYPQSNPFVELAGRPLLWYTLHPLQNAKGLDRVILATDDDEVLDYGREFPGLELFKRPPEFSKATTRMGQLTKFILESLQTRKNYEPEAVCILYISTPLRRARHIDKAIDTMAIYGVDSVISVREELAACYQHRRFGLTPISNSKGSYRLEKDVVYKENGAIFLTRASVIKSGELLGKKIGHIIMLPEESIKINTAFDLWLAEKIMMEWRPQSGWTNQESSGPLTP
jgi:glycosyltransferase involved in cell wall biosynthesis